MHHAYVVFIRLLNTHLDGGSIRFDSGRRSSRYDFNADEGGSSGSRYVERPMHPPSINA